METCCFTKFKVMMGVQSDRFLDEDQEIKDKIKKKSPWTLKCAQEKTGDRLWKFQEVILGTNVSLF